MALIKLPTGGSFGALCVLLSKHFFIMGVLWSFRECWALIKNQFHVDNRNAHPVLYKQHKNSILSIYFIPYSQKASNTTEQQQLRLNFQNTRASLKINQNVCLPTRNVFEAHNFTNIFKL